MGKRVVAYFLVLCQKVQPLICSATSLTLDQRQLSSIRRHASPVLTEYRHPVCSEQLAAGGVVSAGQVVQVMIAPISLLVAGQSLVFLTCDHLTLMRDCLDVVFILMA